MRIGGKTLGIVVILVTVLLVAFSVQYNRTLQEQRNETIQNLASLPPAAECQYENPSLCPQAEDVSLPDTTSVGLVLLGVLLGLYLIRSDMTQRKLVAELQSRKKHLEGKERRELILGVLTDEERSVVEAVRKQPGITQATLRLRTDLSKSKLSLVLGELGKRGLIVKEPRGRTNEIHLKIEL